MKKKRVKIRRIGWKITKIEKFERECKNVLLIRVIFSMIYNDKTMFYDMYKASKKICKKPIEVKKL